MEYAQLLITRKLEELTEEIARRDSDTSWQKTTRFSGLISDTNEYFWFHSGERIAYMSKRDLLAELLAELTTS